MTRDNSSDANYSVVQMLHNTTALNNASCDNNYGRMTFSAIAMALTLLTNGLVLMTFLTHRELRSPFALYVMNLLSSNLYLAIADPMRIIDSISTDWYPKTTACYFQIINDWIGSAILGHAHLLITLNRVWAIVFPISYKQQHTKTMAKCICIGCAVYCHLVILPIIIIDFAYYRGPTLNVTSCDIDTGSQKMYSDFLLRGFFQVPFFIILGAYPLLFWKRHSTQKVSARLFNPNIILGGASEKVTLPHVPQAGSTRHREGVKRPFYVLTAMTLSVLICWGPTKVTNIIQTVLGSDSNVYEELRKTGQIMYEIQCFIDPIVFTLVLSDLRVVVGNICGQLFCKRQLYTRRCSRH
ncbi:somatostatin receptor type 1-like [Paramacrobiotus metropolitanus]|uniref:somatostatin receptor type 1-like n=1 Tax=Paramacrobiotus metropolitanus TaxID=2943436 RepID=UPI0024460700|nr:somatostatin receptor type 1-like [Paramacrobiotus metropolitanus]